MNTTKTKKNGYRIAWFIPVEMFLSGSALFLHMRFSAWAAAAFILFAGVILSKYSTYEITKKPTLKTITKTNPPLKAPSEIAAKTPKTKYNPLPAASLALAPSVRS